MVESDDDFELQTPVKTVSDDDFVTSKVQTQPAGSTGASVTEVLQFAV